MTGIYPYVITYETSVIADQGFTTKDKEIIPTASSIARHGLYYSSEKKKRPRDRDWDISWGNIIAGTEGVQESTAKAVILTAVTGAVVNR